MPNPLTHKYVADLIFEKLPNDIKIMIAEDKAAYNFGCLGPDVLMAMMFHKDPYKKELGSFLHLNYIYEGICNAAKYVEQNQHDSGVFAYFMGFLCHYATDSVVHPYVYSFVGWDDMALHALVETQMDCYIGHTFLNGKNANSKKLFAWNKKMRNTVLRYYDTYKTELCPKDIKSAFFLYKMLMKFTQRHKIGNFCRWLVQKADKISGTGGKLAASVRTKNLSTNHLNFEKQSYPSVYRSDESEKVNHSFVELIDLAVDFGAELINKANAHIFDGETLGLDNFKLTFDGFYNTEYLEHKDNL
jgi:hypothetical protein